MRFGFWAVVALVFGAVITHFVLQDRGYVLISMRGYVIEMSVPALIVVLVAGYFAVRFLLGLWRAPKNLGVALAERRNRTAGVALTDGLMHLSAGDWARGERLLTRSLRSTDAPLASYLMAARAAQQQGAVSRRNEWLKLAFEELPDAESAILVTQAELQIENKELEAAAASLHRLIEKQPNHAVAVGLLARVEYQLGDGEAVLNLLPQLGDAELDDGERQTLAKFGLSAAEAQDGFDLAAIDTVYKQLSKALQRHPKLVEWRAHALASVGASETAENELRKALKREWAEELVLAYGQIVVGDGRKQLKQSEKWLQKYPDDAALLLTTGQLCIASELWGKARSYLESSLALAPNPNAYALYGKLLVQLGETEAAADAYRQGLGLMSGVDLDRPSLTAPEVKSADA